MDPGKCTGIDAALMAHLRSVVQNLGETGNFECVLFFSNLLFCRGRSWGIYKVDKVGFNEREINFQKADVTYQFSKKKSAMISP